MKEHNLKQFAHIGDAVWELFVREFCIDYAFDTKKLHNLTVKYVNAQFQADKLLALENILDDNEKELLRRGRNLKITINKKSNPAIHRAATAFEVLFGYWYLLDKKRLEEIFEIIKKRLIEDQNA